MSDHIGLYALRVHSVYILFSELYTFVSLLPSAMSGNPAVVMRLVASAYAVAEKAGAIIRRDRGKSWTY